MMSSRDHGSGRFDRLDSWLILASVAAILAGLQQFYMGIHNLQPAVNPLVACAIVFGGIGWLLTAITASISGVGTPVTTSQVPAASVRYIGE